MMSRESAGRKRFLLYAGIQVPARKRAFLQQIAVPGVPSSSSGISELVGSTVSSTFHAKRYPVDELIHGSAREPGVRLVIVKQCIEYIMALRAEGISRSLQLAVRP